MTEVFFKVKTIIAENAIVIFSKSYCPYCQRIKAFLRELKHEAAVFELDLLPDGSQMQDVLLKMTGQRTVPNIFISQQHIGGHDAAMQLHSDGKLVPLLREAKASRPRPAHKDVKKEL